MNLCSMASPLTDKFVLEGHCPGNDYPHTLAPNSPSMPKRKDPSTVSRAASLSSQTLMIQLTDQQSVGEGHVQITSAKF